MLQWSNVAGLNLEGHQRSFFASRPVGTLFNPSPQERALLLGQQYPIGWHCFVLLAMSNRSHGVDKAGVGITGNNSGTSVSGAKCVISRLDIEAAHQDFGLMTCQAIGFQQGPNFRGEIHRSDRLGFGG